MCKQCVHLPWQASERSTLQTFMEMWNVCVLHNVRAQRSLEQFLAVVLGAFLEP